MSELNEAGFGDGLTSAFLMGIAYVVKSIDQH